MSAVPKSFLGGTSNGFLICQLTGLSSTPARSRSASIDALGNRTTYAYDQFGNLASVTDPLGHATVYEYDLRGRKTYEGGATYPVRYAYDLFGNKVSMTTYRDEDAQEGDVTTWLYDVASGGMTNKVYADGKGPTYSYTPNGKLSRRTWARGIMTDYVYDGWGNLTNTVYSDDTPTISLVYNAFGRQTEAHDAAGVTTFAYDDFGSLANETVIGVAGTNTIERFYDSFGRDTGYALNGIRQSTLSYDAATGRLASMQIPAIEDKQNHCPPPPLFSTFHWTYLAGSNFKSSLVYPNGLSASWTYGNRGELLEVDNALSDGSVSKYVYTYDAVGRRVACVKSGSAFTTPDTYAYLYNTRSELTNATASVDAAYRYGYDFDDIGNRRSSLECGVQSAEYEANNLNQYTAVDAFVPQYDADGNQTLVKTATGIWSVTYNGENRPILWTLVNSSTHNPTTPTLISMSYDRMGRRVTKSNQRFVYDGYLQIANFELQTSNIKLQTFIWDPTESVATRPLVWNCSTFQPFNFSTSYYTHDGNKNVSDVVGGNGDIVAHYEYAPFGDLILQYGISAAVNPWCFSSEYAENDTAMLCYNYRHCDIHLGRWINPDPICVPMYDCKNKRWTGIDIYGSDMKALYYFLENSPCNAFDYLGLRITEQECKALINRLWFFNYESGLDVDVFGMKVEIESGWGCENPCRLKN